MDLRIAHFFSIHAIQWLPFLGFFLELRATRSQTAPSEEQITRRLAQAEAKKHTVWAAWAFGAWVTFLIVYALMGRSILAWAS